MEKTDSNPTKDYQGIKGWLGWLTAGVVISPIIYIHTVYTTRSSYSDLIHVGYTDGVSFEIFANILLAILSAYSAYLIFQKKSVAKFFLIATFVAPIIVELLDNTFANIMIRSLVHRSLLTQSQGVEFTSTNANVVRSVLLSLIWIPYLMKSKRIKATLINGRSKGSDDGMPQSEQSSGD